MSRTIAVITMAIAVAAVAVLTAFGLALSRPATGTSGTTANSDPLANPAVVAFRQGEHAAAVSNRDPLAAAGLAAFRQSEHTVQNTVSFRDSERADNYGTQWSKDPLAAPNIIQFRNSEHTDAGR